MQNVLFITDLGENAVQVSWQHGKTPRLYAAPSHSVNPLTEEDQQQLAWYIEEYLDFPFGAEDWKAKQVEQQMAIWGEVLFRRIFHKDQVDAQKSAYSLYQEATRSGLHKCEVCIESMDPAFLSIEWELLRDPSVGRGYLAPLLGGLYRRLLDQSTLLSSRPKTKPFRILFIIARPSDASLLPIDEAQGILEVIRPLQPHIQIDLLRPSTFDALQNKLNAEPGYYQLVHFDGHGAFDGQQGNLLLERVDGQSDIVSADALGQLLANCRVPLFVLSACQTSQERCVRPYSSVASRLVATGVAGVVAMSHSIHTDAASRFMERFYEALIHGSTLSEAVAAGRRRLYAEPGRQSIVGTIPLCDWMVPILYQQSSGYTPFTKTPNIGHAGNTQAVEQLLGQVSKACPERRFGFVGRGQDILHIERALADSNSPCVVISGISGVGKTELAYGFARWYAQTGGCPSGVFATSFRHKASFGQVAASIAGVTDTLALSESDLCRSLAEFLKNNKCLLVWDSVETIDGYADGMPLASTKDRKQLSDLIATLRGSNSRIIITTRRPQEAWITTPFTLLEIGGLNIAESSQLARMILGTVGRKPEDYKSDEDYLSLLQLLEGHPRSLEIVLPHLRSRSPRSIMDAIQHRIGTLSETLVDASMQYAFSGLSCNAQAHIPLLGVFASRCWPSMMAAFEKDCESRGISARPPIDMNDWEQVLNEAADLGLLRMLPGPAYELHPTIAPFLRTKLLSQLGEEQLRAIDVLISEGYASISSRLLVGLQSRDEVAITRLLADEENFLRALRVAEQTCMWLCVQVIAQVIHEFYEYCGRWQEWRSLRRRLLDSLGLDVSNSTTIEYTSLSYYLHSAEANEAILRGDLQYAESIYQHVIDILSPTMDDHDAHMLAACYHDLGIIEEKRHHFEEAEEHYRAALQVYEQLNSDREVAVEYLHLGIIAQNVGDLDQAEILCKKALEVNKRISSDRDVALDYHQLGRIAEQRRLWDEAERWCRMALGINERLDFAQAAATNYHELGVISRERKCHDDAEGYHRLALMIYDQLESPIDVAFEYLHLGIIAQDRKQVAEAEVWYQHALNICEVQKNAPLAGRIYGQLGTLRCEQRRLCEAVGLIGKAALIAWNGSVESLAPALYNLASLHQELGEDEFLKIWLAEFGEIESCLLEGLREVQDNRGKTPDK